MLPRKAEGSLWKISLTHTLSNTWARRNPTSRNAVGCYVASGACV